MTVGADRFRLRRGANGAVKGLHARVGAGGLGRDFAFVPGVIRGIAVLIAAVHALEAVRAVAVVLRFAGVAVVLLRDGLFRDRRFRRSGFRREVFIADSAVIILVVARRKTGRSLRLDLRHGVAVGGDRLFRHGGDSRTGRVAEILLAAGAVPIGVVAGRVAGGGFRLCLRQGAGVVRCVELSAFKGVRAVVFHRVADRAGVIVSCPGNTGGGGIQGVGADRLLCPGVRRNGDGLRLGAVTDGTGVRPDSGFRTGGLLRHRAVVPGVVRLFFMIVIIGADALVLIVVQLGPRAPVVGGGINGDFFRSGVRIIIRTMEGPDAFGRASGSGRHCSLVPVVGVAVNGPVFGLTGGALGFGNTGRRAAGVVGLGGGDGAADGTYLPMLVGVSGPFAAFRVAVGFNSGMTADPLIAGGAEDARRITAGGAGGGHRSAVFRGLVVGAVHIAVGGGALGTDRLIHAVGRATGAVLRGVDRTVQTVRGAAGALSVVRTAADVMICAGKIVAQLISVFRLTIGTDRAITVMRAARRASGGVCGPTSERMVRLGGGDVAADAAHFPVLAAVRHPRAVFAVAGGANRRMTADPRVTGGAEDARRIAAGRTGSGDRRAVFRGLVIIGVHAAVGGITFCTNRFVNAVGRAAGAVLRGVDSTIITIGATTGAFIIMFTRTDVYTGAGKAMPKGRTGSKGIR